MPEIAGIVVLREVANGKSRSQEKLVSVGADHLAYRTARATYRVSAGSFFQTNRHLTDELVRIVTEGQSGDSALDLYAGVGLFSTALACDIRHIVSVESSQTSTADLSYNLSSKGKAVQATTEQYLAGLGNSGRSGKGAALLHTFRTPDLAVVDPPRSGLGERVARALVNLGAPRVIYVSCDPVTLARDLVTLLGSGYRIEQMHLVDLFPQTFHLETVVHLVR
jgi:23S rRNA (uracil1939-C5)-methyltransferase